MDTPTLVFILISSFFVTIGICYCCCAIHLHSKYNKDKNKSEEKTQLCSHHASSANRLIHEHPSVSHSRSSLPYLNKSSSTGTGNHQINCTAPVEHVVVSLPAADGPAFSNSVPYLPPAPSLGTTGNHQINCTTAPVEHVVVSLPAADRPASSNSVPSLPPAPSLVEEIVELCSQPSTSLNGLVNPAMAHSRSSSPFLPKSSFAGNRNYLTDGPESSKLLPTTADFTGKGSTSSRNFLYPPEQQPLGTRNTTPVEEDLLISLSRTSSFGEYAFNLPSSPEQPLLDGRSYEINSPTPIEQDLVAPLPTAPDFIVDVPASSYSMPYLPPPPSIGFKFPVEIHDNEAQNPNNTCPYPTAIPRPLSRRQSLPVASEPLRNNTDRPDGVVIINEVKMKSPYRTGQSPWRSVTYKKTKSLDLDETPLGYFDTVGGSDLTPLTDVNEEINEQEMPK